MTLLFTGVEGVVSGKESVEYPDISTLPKDLSPPVLAQGKPEPGKKVRVEFGPSLNSRVHHALYLPTEWSPTGVYPVLVEYPGNGDYQNEYGDICTGRVEDCSLGYGISGGTGFIWVSVPFVSEDGTENQLRWWGSVEKTVEYCKAVVSDVCENWGGNPDQVFLIGFSRGSIACNYIGLHDDEIASLWRGFVCHSHYDGVRAWNDQGSDRETSQSRLDRLGGRPQWISHEGSTAETKEYLSRQYPVENFRFVDIPYRNHTTEWVLRDIPERRALREWIAEILDRYLDR